MSLAMQPSYDLSRHTLNAPDSTVTVGIVPVSAADTVDTEQLFQVERVTTSGASRLCITLGKPVTMQDAKFELRGANFELTGLGYAHGTVEPRSAINAGLCPLIPAHHVPADRQRWGAVEQRHDVVGWSAIPGSVDVLVRRIDPTVAGIEVQVERSAQVARRALRIRPDTWELLTSPLEVGTAVLTSVCPHGFVTLLDLPTRQHVDQQHLPWRARLGSLTRLVQPDIGLGIQVPPLFGGSIAWLREEVEERWRQPRTDAPRDHLEWAAMGQQGPLVRTRAWDTPERLDIWTQQTPPQWRLA